MAESEDLELEEDTQDWDLEERDKWFDENDSEDLKDPTEIAVKEDE